VYFVPLPPLCQRLIKPLMKADARLFSSLPVHQTKADRPTFDGKELKSQLVEFGAPKDFTYHGWRHTISTFLENDGHSEWERGLVLNHAGSGSVTADYSHGYPLELKLKLLTKWADHVEKLIQPEGAALLR
jgi:integrase